MPQETVEVQFVNPPKQPGWSGSMLEVIERAARDPSVDMAKLEKLLEMQERVVAKEAKAQFYRDFSAMQNDLPVIEKRGRIKFNKQDDGQPFARWEDINEAIKPILTQHGFSLSFRTGFTADRVSVTGILSHRDGHVEETTLPLPLDTSGSKNNVQAVGSSTSYGKRYVASALLNITMTDEDDDAHYGGGSGLISEQQHETIASLLKKTGSDEDRFCKKMGVGAIETIPAKRFNEAVEIINLNYAKKQAQK